MITLSEFTIETMAARLAELAPAFELTTSDSEITARLPGVVVYLRVKPRAIYGPGLGWSFEAMGPSEWGDNDPDDVVQQFCITRAERIAQVVEWLADRAWADRQSA